MNVGRTATAAAARAVGDGGADANSSGSRNGGGADGDSAFGSGASAQQSRPRTGYTEWDELRIVDDASANTAEGSLTTATAGAARAFAAVPSSTVIGDRKRRLTTSPDGHWAHMDLALKLADLLAMNAALLNSGGTTFAGGAAETLFPIGAQYRRGGFLRIFCRLVRVAASMTLCGAQQLDEVILLLEAYVRRVDSAVPVGFLTLKKRAVNLEEAKEHTSLTATMTLLYVVHDLLVRRLRSSAALSGTDSLAYVNVALVDKLKCLFILCRRPLEHLPVFTSSHEGDGCNASERFVRHERTAHWLTTRSFTAADTAAAATATLEAFVEIASRNDYNAFMEKCILVMERDQLTDKALATEVAAERAQRMTQLRNTITSLAVAQQVVAEAMRRLVDEREVALTATTPLSASATNAGGLIRSESAAAATAVPLGEAAAMMTSVARAGVWANFFEATRGTIWNVEATTPRAAQRFVRLSTEEQQPLLRRKVRPWHDGRRHRQGTERARGRFLVASAASNKDGDGEGADASRSANDGIGSDVETTSRLRLRGGEAVLLESRCVDEDGTTANINATMTTGSVDDQPSVGDSETAESGETEAVAQRQDLKQTKASPQLQTVAEEEATAAAAAAAAAVPVLLSLPCEVPYLMHCWSATFTIRDGDICILFDEVNTAYNQKIADEARPFLSRPRNLSFSATSIVQIAPARRFRMKRTALEMWLRDRRSCFVNFSDASVMRLALQKVCQVAALRHRTGSGGGAGGGGGGMFYGRRLVAEMAAGLLARQRHGLLGAAAATLPTLSVAARGRHLYVYQENPLKEPLRLHFMQLWQNRDMSSFDYLLWLNLLSGRSVNDITQYPVFPWILADYTSDALDLSNPATFRDLRQPIGACGDQTRRDMIRRRYEDMKALGDVPAHYFTHYSSPAVVIYFMVRLEPFTTLQLLLQGGHFDHPDRMFHSMRAAYRAVTTSTQDTRELTPELYYLPEVCMNGNDVHFGVKQDGSVMDHLQLPPWAHDSPHEFVYLMRAALECDHVSANLHHWIDLVFGAGQRGKEAIEALNVFNWHSYEDLDRHRGDAVDQQLLIDSLDNIGQTPIQLFRQPHVARRQREVASVFECGVSVKTFYPRLGAVQRVARLSLDVADRLVLVGGTGVTVSLKLTGQPLKRRSAGGGNVAAATDGDGYHYVAARRPSPQSQSQSLLQSPIGWRGTPLSANSRCSAFLSSPQTPPQTCALPPPLLSPRGSGVHHGGFDAYSFDVSEEFDRRIAPVPPGIIPNASGPEAASDGPCAPDNVALLSFGTESYVVLGGMYDNSVVVRALSGMADDLRLVAHRGRVVQLAASGDSQFLVTGAEDTTFVVWACGVSATGGRRATLEVALLFTIYGHEDNPTAAEVSSTLDLVATASRDGALLLHSLSSGRLDHTIRHPQGHSIDRVLIQPNCYVPNVLYFSHVDQVVHQISVNGTPLRTFTPPGRVTSWASTSEQFLVLTCAPHNRAATTFATAAAAAYTFSSTEEGNDFAAAAAGDTQGFPTAATSPSTVPNAATAATPSCGVFYVHAFYLYILRSVPLPADTAVQCIAVHPRTPQITILGTRACSVLLVRSTLQQSTVL